MKRSERAKQFMPFAAVVGLEDALRQKEQEVEADYGIINRNVRYEPFDDETGPAKGTDGACKDEEE